jgi:uncharacterized membrane protein
MGNDKFVASNVVVVSFDDDTDAYEAMTALKELDSQDQIDLHAAAVVLRHDDGQLAIKDEVAEHSFSGTAGGGIIGLLIGVLTGPLGILVGGVTGLLVGTLFDVEDDDERESVLSDIARYARVGRTTLLAEVDEPSPEVIDTAMARITGTVMRRPVADVEAEIAVAGKAQRAAQKKARKVLRKQRLAAHEADVRAKVEELKAKLRRHERTPASA